MIRLIQQQSSTRPSDVPRFEPLEWDGQRDGSKSLPILTNFGGNNVNQLVNMFEKKSFRGRCSAQLRDFVPPLEVIHSSAMQVGLAENASFDLLERYIYIYIIYIAHIHIHTYIHAYIHTYIQTYTHIHTHMHTHMHTHIHTYMHACIHTYMHTYIHRYMHKCMHACLHTL